MKFWRVAVAFPAAALLLLAGCGANREAAHGSPTAAPSSPAVEEFVAAQLEEQSVVYQIAGEYSTLWDLYRVTFPPLRFERLARGKILTSVDARGDLVVISGGIDAHYSQIYLYAEGEFALVPGLENAQAFGPRISPDGTLVYAQVDHKPSKVYHIRTWDLGAQTGNTLLSEAEQIGGFALDGDGNLTLLRGPPGSKRLLIVDRDGGRREVDIGMPSAHILRLSRSGWIALSANKSKPESPVDLRATVMVDPNGNPQPIIEGWVARAWSPDGGSLLMNNGLTLGVAKPPNFRNPTILGSSTVGKLWEAGWAK